MLQILKCWVYPLIISNHCSYDKPNFLQTRHDNLSDARMSLHYLQPPFIQTFLPAFSPSTSPLAHKTASSFAIEDFSVKVAPGLPSLSY